MYQPQQPMQNQSPFLQFNPGVFNPGLPQNPGSYPAVQPQNQQLLPWVPHAAGMLKAALANGVQQNAHYATGIAILSDQNWVNQEMAMLLSMIVDHAAAIHYTQNLQPEQAIQAAAQAAADGYSANKQLMVLQQNQMTMDPNYMNYLSQQAAQWTSMMQAVMSTPRAGVVAPGYGVPGPVQNPQMQGQFVNRVMPAAAGIGGATGSAAAGTGRGLVSGRFSSGAAPVNQVQPVTAAAPQYNQNYHRQPTQVATARDLLSNPNNPQGAPNVTIPAPNPERPAVGHTTPVSWGPAQSSAETLTLTPNQPEVKLDVELPPGVNYNDYTPIEKDKPLPACRDLSRPHDDFLARDGSWMAPSILHPEIQRTWIASHPHRHVYDPDKRIVFLRRPPGKFAGRVVEEIHNWNEKMDYLKHEINSQLRERELRRRQQNSAEVEVLAPVAWNVVSTLRPEDHHSISLPQDPGANLEALETYQVTKAGQHFYAESIGEALLLARDLSVIVGDGDTSPGTMEFYYDQPELVDCNPQQLKCVLQLNKAAKDFDKLHEKLKEVMEQETDESSQKLFGLLDKRLTSAVNEAVERTFSVEGWSIDSFVADFPDLMASFKEEYGDRLVTAFRETASLVTRPALAVATLDELQKYLTHSVGLEPEEVEEKITQKILLVYRVSVTTVGWERGAINAFIDGGGLVDRESLPELHDAIQTIFDRTPDNPLFFANRFLLTKDLNLLEIRKAGLVKDSFLIFDDGYLEMPLPELNSDDLVLDQ